MDNLLKAMQQGMQNANLETSKIKSNGGSTSYYDIPLNAKDLQDLIEYKNMGFALGNIFKACYRFGEKEGNELEYEIRKMEFFIDRLKKVYQVNDKETT